MADIINLLSALPGDHGLARLREKRPQVLENAQASFEALFEPVDPGSFSFAERYAVAAYVSGLHRVANARTFYTELLRDDAPDALVDAVDTIIEASLSTGPYGTYREPGLSGDSEPGGHVLNDKGGLGTRLAAAFDFAHLLVFHPRDSRPESIRRLVSAGWSADDVVSLAQLISFLTFQLRVVHGLQTLAGRDVEVKADDKARHPGLAAEDVEWELPDRGLFEITTYPDLVRPAAFVNHALGWKPWVPPVVRAELTDGQRDALITPERADMPYFRLLARDPAVLKARTLTDSGIFHNTDGGLGRAGRELVALLTSRLNGCVYCAAVHAERTVEEGGDAAVVDKLLDDGLDIDLGSDRWNVLRDASRTLAFTPMEYNAGCVGKLRAVGLDDAALLDHLYAVSFVNWANRLMLSLGEPEVPVRFR
ncbi:alkylhydroperoxidase domain protein [Corynebacterium halotolerans]|uniref:Carboxymuconolactone decarboxylase-like domain-containing protein n=1 Tax=Corynebacterium halotolerans YIM 70093 = DSM 44683 TaxID=1121362 RepID=M1NPD8_9CORY|nr:alkylhydroperoxidase domain protein [Corynebacterium halotolerans]AGF73253.1 hypothetical protein A605_11265 [Corynebacterium halotolerans YIM 70093 = DSM 44683]